MTTDLFDNPTAEEWRSIQGFPGYEVSSLGRVRTVVDRQHLKAGQQIAAYARPGKYLMVGLYLPGGRRRMLSVHRLVCSAFCGKPVFGWNACHLDGDRRNNRADNLRWQTVSQNHLDKHRHGTMTQAKLSAEQVIAIRSTPRVKGVLAALAERYGVSVHTVRLYRVRNYKGAWRHLPSTSPPSPASDLVGARPGPETA